MRLVLNFSSILKLDKLHTFNVQIDRVDMSFGSEGGVAPPAVRVVGTHLKHVGNRWMVTHLFHEHGRSVFEIALVRFTENWVQRLVPDVARMDERQGSGHHQFHSFNGVGGVRGRVQVERSVD